MTVEEIRRQLATLIVTMQGDLPKLEAAYQALGGDLEMLAKTPGENAVVQKALGHLEDGAARTSELAEALRAEGVDVTREELYRMLEESPKVERGDRGWWRSNPEHRGSPFNRGEALEHLILEANGLSSRMTAERVAQAFRHDYPDEDAHCIELAAQGVLQDLEERGKIRQIEAEGCSPTYVRKK